MSTRSGSEFRFLFSVVVRPDSPDEPPLEMAVVDFTAWEQLSFPFHVRLSLASEDEIDFDDVIGKDALLTIRGDVTDRFFHGIISQFMQTGTKGRFFLYEASVVPSVWLLSLKQDCRIFQNKTVKEIVSQVLRDANISSDRFVFRPENIGDQVREYCVQYREKDLDFVSRLLEEEGIFYFFEYGENLHMLVFGDSPAVYQPIAGEHSDDDRQAQSPPAVRYHPADGMVPDEECVYKFLYSRRIYSGKVTLRDFNFETPSGHQTALTAEQQARDSAFHGLEVYDYPGRFADETRGRNLSQIRLDRTILFKERGRGESTCSRFGSGFTFTLEEHDRENLNQEYLLVEVVHRGVQPQVLEELTDTGRSSEYGNRFLCVPATVIFRPFKGKPKPMVHGPQTAIVVGPGGEEIYTDEDGHGRVKVQFHWDRQGQYNEESSCWVRVSHNWAGGRYGYFSLPRVGQEVIVSFLEGDPDRPVITGRVYNADHMPPFSLPDEKTKSTIKSKTYQGEGANEITFEDNAGQEQIFIHAQKDLDIRVLNDHKLTVDNERHLVIKGASKIKASSSDVTVEGDEAIKVDGQRSVTVQGDVIESFQANHGEQVGGEYGLNAGTKVIIEAGMQVTLKAAGGFVDIGPAGVTIQGNMVMINSGGAAGSSGISGSAVSPQPPDEAGAAVSGADTVYSPVAARAATVREEEPPEEEEAEVTVNPVIRVFDSARGRTMDQNTQAAAPGRVVVLKRDYMALRRVQVELTTDRAHDGTGTLDITGAGIRIFDADAAGNQINSGHVFPGADLSRGVRVYVEGTAVSGGPGDMQIRLTLNEGSNPVGPAVRALFTVVELRLDVCRSRTQRGVDPTPLSAADKINTGRFVHVQSGNHHGRAMLIVHKARPEAFNGDLVLARNDNRVNAFATAQEIAAGGQVGLTDPNPHIVANGAVAAGGLKLWAQGERVSGALRDTGFRLGVRYQFGPGQTDVEQEGDRVALTVARLRRLQALIRVTPPNRVRGNWPAAHRTHVIRRGTTANPDPTNYEESFTNNPPLVLVEGSVLNDKPVELGVQVEPAGTPVAWAVIRDGRPAPDGDHADIRAMVPGVPTLGSVSPPDPLRATLLADGVGSFHISSYIDCNGNGQFTFNDQHWNRIDREPFIFMNLVLMRVQADENRSRARANDVTINPANPTSATGLTVSTGQWNYNRAACVNDAWVKVYGGGGDGRRGLTSLFGGWVNNELAVPGSPTAPRGEDVVAEYRHAPGAPAPVQTHRRISIWTRSVAAGTVIAPAGAAPVLLAGPLLDVSPFGNEGTGGNTCIGTETPAAPGPPPPPAAGQHRGIQKQNIPGETIGQRWRIRMYDSPGDHCPAAHGHHPGQLVSYRFNLNFRSDLCFWTNTSGNRGATAHAACRLYASVLSNRWYIRISYTFNAVTGVSAHPAHRIWMNRDTRIAAGGSPPPGPTATPVEGSGLEVRHPISLRVLATDART
jgi:type VI secretion system secreted protein VgrG